MEVIQPIIEARDKTRAEEFRRLAVMADHAEKTAQNEIHWHRSNAQREAWTQAAQMLKERLN